jgi:hypothetical protein
MFYGECYKCGERWELGTASTCKCEDEVKWDASAPVLITSHPYFYKRPWVGLTDEAIWSEYQTLWPFHPAEEPRLAKDIAKFARAIEAKLKEKNA